MNNAEILTAVIQQLREIFLNGGELKGYDDWDRFFGCINAIERVANNIAESKEETVEE